MLDSVNAFPKLQNAAAHVITSRIVIPAEAIFFNLYRRFCPYKQGLVAQISSDPMRQGGGPNRKMERR
jgi:hypothetical protein